MRRPRFEASIVRHAEPNLNARRAASTAIFTSACVVVSRGKFFVYNQIQIFSNANEPILQKKMWR